jgi:tetratricopeptide (TPR) repeat protein
MEAGSRFWMRRALAAMQEHPGRTAWLWGRKALLFLAPDEIPQINDFQILAVHAAPLRLAFLRFGMLLPFALLGLWFARRDGRTLAPWCILIAAGWIVTIVFFAAGRYRIPLLPAFFALGAYGLFGALQAVRRRRPLPLIAALLAAVGLSLLPPSYPAAQARAFDAFQMGVRFTRDGRIPAALQAYEAAIAAAPGSGEAWHGRGTALYRLGRADEAVAAYREALRLMPHSAVTCYALGLAHLELGEPHEAAQALAAAVQRNGDQPAYWLALGDARSLAGDAASAADAWRRALALAPGDPEALRRLSPGAGGE